MKTVRRVLTVSILTLSAVGLASADALIHHTGSLTAVYTDAAGPTVLDFPLPSVNVSFSKFDPGAICNGSNTINCQLTSIHFTVDSLIDAHYTITNNSTLNTKHFTANLSADIAINDLTNTFQYVRTLPTAHFSFPAVGPSTTVGDPHVLVTGSDFANYSCAGASCTVVTSSAIVSSPINSAPFIGPGNITLSVTGLMTATFGGSPSSFTFGGSASENIGIQYDYSYDQVVTPEPLTFALVGGGLIGAGLLRKRFSRR